MHHFITGNNFTEAGFEQIVQFMYTGFVPAVTEGLLDVDKVAVALQAADFFGIAALRHAAEQFVKLCGGSV
jgi:BTB/POZ domain